MVNDKRLSRNKKDIIDPFVIQQTSKLIDRYYNTLNKIDTQGWTVKEMWTILRKEKMVYRSLCTLVSILRR